jgi:hypothetical protein
MIIYGSGQARHARFEGGKIFIFLALQNLKNEKVGSENEKIKRYLGRKSL